MKFRTLSWLKYLIKARHRGGHGIHSPFLYRLITEVIEDKRNYPEYDLYKVLERKFSTLLLSKSVTSRWRTDHHVGGNLAQSGKRDNNIEMPPKYVKMMFRLIRDFRPSAVIHYGSGFGPFLAVMAMADNSIPVYQISDSPEYDFFSAELLKNLTIHNIHFLPDNSEQLVSPVFTLINYPEDPDKTRAIIQKIILRHCDNDILIVRGLHQSMTMELVWQELIGNRAVRVSLDQFEIGIVLFRKGLQKEDFIHWF